MTTVGDGGLRPCRISQRTGAVPQRPGMIPLNVIPPFSPTADLFRSSSSFLLPDLPPFLSAPPTSLFLPKFPKYSICSFPAFFQTSHLLLPMLLLLLVLLLPVFPPSPPSQTSKQDLIGRWSSGCGGAGRGDQTLTDRRSV